MLAEIFYVEDNPAEVFLLQEAVRKLSENFRVVPAGDGETALAMLRSASVLPCVIVLDVHVPKIDGAEVLKAVKSHPGLRTVPTVVFAEGAARRKIQSTENAPDLFLSKPMDLEGYANVAERIIALCVSPV
jgi:CheY-like chemotaxis protein